MMREVKYLRMKEKQFTKYKNISAYYSGFPALIRPLYLKNVRLAFKCISGYWIDALQKKKKNLTLNAGVSRWRKKIVRHGIYISKKKKKQNPDLLRGES